MSYREAATKLIARTIIGNYVIDDDGACVKSFPHPRSLSRRAREEKPFSPREKGGDEGRFSVITNVTYSAGVD